MDQGATERARQARGRAGGVTRCHQVQVADRPSPIDRIVTRFVSVPLPAPIRHPFLGARTKFSSLLVEVHTGDARKLLEATRAAYPKSKFLPEIEAYLAKLPPA